MIGPHITAAESDEISRELVEHSVEVPEGYTHVGMVQRPYSDIEHIFIVGAHVPPMFWCVECRKWHSLIPTAEDA